MDAWMHVWMHRCTVVQAGQLRSWLLNTFSIQYFTPVFCPFFIHFRVLHSFFPLLWLLPFQALGYKMLAAGTNDTTPRLVQKGDTDANEAEERDEGHLPGDEGQRLSL